MKDEGNSLQSDCFVSIDCCEPISAEIKQTTSEDREPETHSDRMRAKEIKLTFKDLSQDNSKKKKEILANICKRSWQV